MKKRIKHYIGIDVSKAWFDLSLLTTIDHIKQPIETVRFDNNPEGMKSLEKWLKLKKVIFNDDSLLVVENTGIYHRLLWKFCSKQQLPIHIGNAAHIKWSFGIARGKNDKIDSQRLCTYAYKCADELQAAPALNSTIMKLKDLMRSRTRLLTQRNSTKAYLNELKASNCKEVQRMMEQVHKSALEGLKKSILLIEKEIREILSQDAVIKKNYKLLISVPGIGPITAVYLICCTNNFICKLSGKQLACYAGVAPFKETSGSSIKGRNKVHKMANKELKKLLFMCALSSIQSYPEMKIYYDRKIADGKHALAVINAIKNKILLRVASVINNEKEYVNKYIKAA